MAKIPISMTDNMEASILERVKEGDFNNVSEYFRDLVRRDLEYREKYAALKQAIQSGIDSGISDKTIDDIWAESKARFRARNG